MASAASSPPTGPGASPTSPSHAPLILVEALVRAFQRRRVVDGVGFAIRRGETVAFLGPNGAGKSTTLRMAAGVLEPDAGEIAIAGCSIVARRGEAQGSLGYLAEGAPLYGDLSAREFLAFMGRARRLRGRQAMDAVARAAEATALEDVLDRPIDTLSKGFRRRVALAGALLHDPPVLLLDEPTDGLDPNQKQAMRALVRRMRPDKAILISTHQLDEVEAMCGRAIVIAGGRVVADDAPEALAARHGGAERSLEAAFHALTATPEGTTSRSGGAERAAPQGLGGAT